MNVTCDNCKTKLSIADHKIPQDKDTTLKCPKCQGIIRIPAVKKAGQPLESSFGNRLNALVCTDDEDLTAKISSAVKQMQFNTHAVETTKAALRKMEYHIYNLVLIDDTFDQNKGAAGIVESMNAFDMSMRRRICLVLISPKYATNDYMTALHLSANNIINKNDLSRLESFLPGILTEHKDFYTVYNDSLKLAGKA